MEGESLGVGRGWGGGRVCEARFFHKSNKML